MEELGSRHRNDVQYYVIKRDGKKQLYSTNKLILSLSKLLKEDKKAIEKIKMIIEKEVEFLVKEQGKISAVQLSTIICTSLENGGFKDARGSYEKFQRDKQQNFDNNRNVQYKIAELEAKEATVVNENANKDSRIFNTQRDLTAGVVSKTMGLKRLPDHVAKAHEKGDIHYHDLDYTPYLPMTNCCLIDFQTMFEKGFYIGNAEVESPKSIQTATAQTAQIIANVASSQYGGCTFDRIDEVLAPFARLNYEKHLNTATKWIDDPEQRELFSRERTKKDIYDAMQSLEYEINTLYTSQGQTPFTSIGFGLGTNWIEKEIQKAILNVRIKGLGKEKRTAIFPKLIFSLKTELNLKPEDPNYDIKVLALECSTKRMYPDVLNYDKLVELTGSFKAPMGCRSFLQAWQDTKGNEISAGRMNLGVVSLNIPRISLEAEGNREEFWTLFDEKMKIMHDALVFKAERVMEAQPENAPILYKYGAFKDRLDADDKVKSLFINRRATVSIGYIGLYETATAFFGPDWENNNRAKTFTFDIVKRLKTYAERWSIETDLHFSVYSTPSESLTDRFCRLDKKKFGRIKDVTDKDYYTNSFHYDVRKNPTPFEKIDFEKDYPRYSSGGFIHYCEYPKLQSNPKALEAVWDYAYPRIAYLGTNTPIDHCYQCGFEGDFHPTAHGFKCPQCKNTDPETCDVVKRTCGYLGNPQKRPMIAGRHKEIASRVKHMKRSEYNESN
ncbi:anaerobic ribonucleoside-triphosphate reductase [Lacticigenium naphthae]|uniref:anaerobic ribonucleoside-triphosphate reductase n=1 Tax=Lacticigenium naphthae TaxID=515351 RepID=UPI0004254655|nr:anaerobic ribonucleoside-triphosphate reductase [Lacticigenium naphthae]